MLKTLNFRDGTPTEFDSIDAAKTQTIHWDNEIWVRHPSHDFMAWLKETYGHTVRAVFVTWGVPRVTADLTQQGRLLVLDNGNIVRQHVTLKDNGDEYAIQRFFLIKSPAPVGYVDIIPPPRNPDGTLRYARFTPPETIPAEPTPTPSLPTLKRKGRPK